MNVRIETYLDNSFWDEEMDEDIKEIEAHDDWIYVNNPYSKKVFRRLYKCLSGYIYGGISIVINGKEAFEILVSYNLNDTWLSLIRYYYYGYDEKRFPINFDNVTHDFLNNQDPNNPQVKLEYYEKYTEWIPVSIMRQAVFDAFLEYMQFMESMFFVVFNPFDFDGEAFEIPYEVEELIKIYESIKNGEEYNFFIDDVEF